MSDFNESSENAAAQEPQDQKKKLTDQQLRIIQVVAGVISAAALMVSLYLPVLLGIMEENSLLQYSFLVVFLVIMFGRRWIENKFRLRLNLFGLVLIDGILSGILLLVLFAPLPMDETLRLAILIGGTVLLLVFGIGWPLLRYRKRLENGTLTPIRMPEKQEETKEDTSKDDGTLSVEQKIALMMRDLDDNKDNKQE